VTAARHTRHASVPDSGMPRTGGAIDLEDGLHVVMGYGPLGRAVSAELLRRGADVAVITRSAPADLPERLRAIEADLADREAARVALADASVAYHCLNAPYSRWPELLPRLTEGVLAGADDAGATLVYGDNLYAYGPVTGPVHERLPEAAGFPNGRVRALVAARLLEAHTAGDLPVVIARGSDFFGPHVRVSLAGAGVVGRLLANQRPQTIGNPDLPHTLTFVEDFAAAMVRLGSAGDAHGRVWHVPNPPTGSLREFAERVARVAGVEPLPLQVAPYLGMRAAAIFAPPVRAVLQVRYQTMRPWVVDHSAYAERFGDHASDWDDAVQRTVDWYGAHAD
jgi:nucleoside-diphosphate-sugar epimerase